MPAAWRDHDEDGVPLWLWFLLALLPLVLVMAALAPEYSAQAVDGIYHVVALPFQVVTSVASNATSRLVEFGQAAGVQTTQLLVDSANGMVTILTLPFRAG